MRQADIDRVTVNVRPLCGEAEGRCLEVGVPLKPHGGNWAFTSESRGWDGTLHALGGGVVKGCAAPVRMPVGNLADTQ